MIRFDTPHYIDAWLTPMDEDPEAAAYLCVQAWDCEDIARVGQMLVADRGNYVHWLRINFGEAENGVTFYQLEVTLNDPKVVSGVVQRAKSALLGSGS